ncbi:MAG: hypothetical protein M3H12_20345 [Chromatiales bacterium]
MPADQMTSMGIERAHHSGWVNRPIKKSLSKKRVVNQTNIALLANNLSAAD